MAARRSGPAGVGVSGSDDRSPSGPPEDGSGGATARLARAAAHDLNNLLNGIGMVIHEARDPQRTASELRAALSDVGSFLTRGEAIVAKLREVARSDASESATERRGEAS